MGSIDFQALGDLHKKMEKVEAGRSIMPGIPLMARLDGRSFHTLTKNFTKPFDLDFMAAMQEAAKSLIKEFKPDVAYTQSDEITLAWANPDQEQTKVMFDGKFQKLCSLLAGHASTVFNWNISHKLQSREDQIPILDCRVWQLPTLQMAASNFLWRELDATNNSINMLASSVFPEKELHGVSTKERLVMLEKNGIIWGNLPVHQKKGAYFAKRKIKRFLSVEELAFIKPEYRPVGPILRSTILELVLPPATKITNFEGVLFREEYVLAENAEPAKEVAADPYGY